VPLAGEKQQLVLPLLNTQVVKVQAASLAHTDGSFVFARLRQGAPRVIHPRQHLRSTAMRPNNNSDTEIVQRVICNPHK